jgi:hypothetical protein
VPVPPPASVTVNAKFVVLLLNMAVTVAAAVNVTEHPAVPPHPAPLQPAKVEPAAAVAVSATTWPLAKLAEHVGWQAIPAGLLITVPVPVPASATVKAKFVVLWVNVAVTVVAAAMVTMHVPVPAHGAPQPVKVEPAAGVAINVICVPLAKLAEHAAPQLIPAGALVTVPVPVPAFVTVKVKLPALGANVAVTPIAIEVVTTQVPVPEQGAPQPVNVEPAAGVAVKVTCVPLLKLAEQVGPQLIPGGALVTVPVPVPALVTVKGNVSVAKVAVTVCAMFMVTVQVGGLVCGFAGTQLSPNEVKVASGPAVAVSSTCVPGA